MLGTDYDWRAYENQALQSALQTVTSFIDIAMATAHATENIVLLTCISQFLGTKVTRVLEKW